MKFQRVSLCLSNLVKTQEREFDRVITRLWFYYLCGWIYYGERSRATLRFCRDISSPLCHWSGNGSSHCLRFITKIQTLRMSFFLFFLTTVFTLLMIRVLLFLLWLWKYHFRSSERGFWLRESDFVPTMCTQFTTVTSIQENIRQAHVVNINYKIHLSAKVFFS